MKIAFIGGGLLASSVAVLAKAKGHDSVFGVRDPLKTSFPDFPRTGFIEAITGADIVVIAIPYQATAEVLPPLADALAGKVVIDTTNAVKADWSPLPTGEESSGAEHIQRLLPRSYVAKAFNTIFAEVIQPHRLNRAGHKISLFVSSNHPKASQSVMEFGAQLGFDAINAGPLKSARYLEAVAHLNLELAFGQGDGMNTAIIYHRSV